jgi:hypothetical protein
MDRFRRFARERAARTEPSASNHLSVDWLDMLRRLEVWDALARGTRAVLASLQSGATVPAYSLGPDFDRLLHGNLLAGSQNGAVGRMHESARSFFRVIRALERHDLLASHGMRDLQAYMGEHFTVAQRQSIAASLHPYEPEWRLAGRVASMAWARDFVDGRSPWAETDAAAMARELLRWFLDHPEWVPLRELPGRCGLEPAAFDSALRFCFERLLLFPTFQRPERNVFAGLWPCVAKRLATPAPVMPVPFQPADKFEGAFLLDDMIVLLIAASGEPLRVRKNDGALFERTMTTLGTQLTPVPAWLGSTEGFGVERRVNDARTMLEALELLVPARDALRSGRAAAAWLSLPEEDRLRQVLDLLRANNHSPADGAARYDAMPDPELPTDEWFEAVDDLDMYDDFEEEDDEFTGFGDDEHPGRFLHRQRALRFLSSSGLEWLPREVQARLSAALQRTFSETSGTDFLPIDEFLLYHALRGNPFLDDDTGMRVMRNVYMSGYSTEEQLEERWSVMLRVFLFERLVPLGGAAIGAAGNRLGFRVTPAGRYVLGLDDTFEFRTLPSAPEGAVVVQPNFEVVFTAPLPGAEAAIARFAERVGQRLGVLFRITRASVLTAAAAGVTADQAIDALKAVSSRSLPANVVREITGWFDEVRRVSLAPAFLLRCPDAHTAARVLAAGGKAVRPVSDTVLELVDPSARARLLKKLRAAGIFIDEFTARPPRRQSRRR